MTSLLSKVRINNNGTVADYDIKDTASRNIVGTITGSEIGAAVGDNTKLTVKDALAKLYADVQAAASSAGNGVTNVDWSSNGITQTIGGATTTAISKSELVSGLRDTVTSSSSTSSTAGFTTPADAQTLIDRAQIGAAMFQGTLTKQDSVQDHDLPVENYKKGWYWIVEVAGTYAGKVCEAGDFLFCIEDWTSAKTGSGSVAWKDDFKVVQGNLLYSVNDVLQYTNYDSTNERLELSRITTYGPGNN